MKGGGEVQAQNAPVAEPGGFLTASDALDAVDVAFMAKGNRPFVRRLPADAALAGAFEMMSVRGGRVHPSLSCPPDKETELPFKDIEVPVAMQ